MATTQPGKNVLYAQAGGVTAVINASAYGVITAHRASGSTGTVYAGLDGINGVVDESLIDVSQESPETIAALRHLPAGAFGSCRSSLHDFVKNRAEFDRILDVCAAHEIGTFFYNGGNGSMATTAALAEYARLQGAPLRVIGIPKTIDNDLVVTDNSPGYGSVAKYIALSMLEACLDTASMYHDSTKVFVLETMGRDVGWIAAATGLASRSDDEGPHLILLPEVPFRSDVFLKAVEASVSKHGMCAVTVSEGLHDRAGNVVSKVQRRRASDFTQLGGAGHFIQELLQRETDLKVHGAVPDYFQRSARHAASATDVAQAIACGEHAVALAAQGLSGLMVTIQRMSDHPYRWGVGYTDAGPVADKEKCLPPEMIREDGFHITQKFRDYCLPLIQGEDPPPYESGLPAYPRLRKVLAPKRLPPFERTLTVR